MTQINSNNNTSPTFLGPPISEGGLNSAANASNTRNNMRDRNNNAPYSTNNNNLNGFIPSQPGIPAAFYPINIGPVNDNRVSQPRTNAYTPDRTNASETEGFVPSQPGIPGAFLPQPLTGIRTINNTASVAIPAEFWIKENSTDYIILKNRLGGYLSCENGTVTTVAQYPNDNTNITNVSTGSILWIPELIRSNVVALKSEDGGYMYLNDNLFYCNGTSSDLNSQFQVRIGLKNDRLRSTDYLALRIDIGYLGIRDDIVMLIQQLDQRSMFDPVRSIQSQPRIRII